MSAKKTALQELIAYLENEIASYSGHDLAPAAVRGALSYAKEHAQQLLPTEEEQIDKAYDAGYENGVDRPDEYKGHDYFTSTYETP